MKFVILDLIISVTFFSWGTYLVVSSPGMSSIIGIVFLVLSVSFLNTGLLPKEEVK